MKHLILSLSILAAIACNKPTEECVGTTSTCFHTVYNSCFVCVKSPTDSSLVLLSYSGGIDTIQMSSCDTSAWLQETRYWDERANTEGSKYWLFFKSIYPDTCGCQ